ncbi:MAG TPA: TlpA disulfide reductase family protein [Thermoanaerobaculia bacterium]|jgi:thiol-disulfide isomerase/thioredoxin|nr:TlpA disulfide reductase family protein [Thermoanaerobaculia bacterium]
MPLLLALLVAVSSNLAEVRSGDEVLRAFRRDAHIRVVNIWATWCAPCVAEMPQLDAISASVRRNGVEFIGVSLDDAIPGVRAERKQLVTRFLTGKHIRFRNVYYVGRTNELADRFRFDGSLPITLIFDEHGRELFRNEGVIDAAKFRRKLDDLIKRRNR